MFYPAYFRWRKLANEFTNIMVPLITRFIRWFVYLYSLEKKLQHNT
jgi:hypothetical protein